MTKNWDAYKSVIVGEYKDNNKALHEVQRIMESKYNFKASCVLPLFSSFSRQHLTPTKLPQISPFTRPSCWNRQICFPGLALGNGDASFSPRPVEVYS